MSPVENARTNWAGNVRFHTADVVAPASVDEVQRAVRGAARARALGAGHSFSPAADTTGTLIDMTTMPARLEIDDDAATVTVSAGTSYGDLCAALSRRGWALPALASLPHITVGGACATGTHGSGDAAGCLATSVAGLEMVTAGGDLVAVDRADQPSTFSGMVVSLGALGIVTSLTLDLMPSFDVRQRVYEGVPFARFVESVDEVTARAYSVSTFTTWRSDVVDQVWVKHRVGDPEPDASDDWLGARPATVDRHPITGWPAEHCTPQCDVVGPWDERLPHFRLGATRGSGDELQSEYMLPRAHVRDALRALYPMREQIASVLQICEIRSIAGDDLWLSPSAGRDTIALHFCWIRDLQRVLPVIAAVEARLAPLAARPHWGKLFTMDAAVVRAMYPRLPDFQRLAEAWDPQGRFRNDFLERYVLRPG